MRKLFAAGVAAVAVWGTGCGSDPKAAAQAPAVQPASAKLPAPDTDPTPKAFVGVWVPVSCQFNGVEQFDEKAKKEFRLSIENGQHKLYLLTDPEKMEGMRIHTATLAVDEKAGTFALEVIDSKFNKGSKRHGIFEISGDRMKLCYGPADQPRPTKFEAPKGSDVFNEVWERHKKK